jgi:hypothetical protein
MKAIRVLIDFLKFIGELLLFAFSLIYLFKILGFRI